MQIQLNTDKNIGQSESLLDFVRTELRSRLAHQADRLTRVEVHIRDKNADRESPGDKHCSVEARPKGMEPIVVNHEADNVHDAIKGAAERMERVLRRTFDKRDEVRP
jgi:ribosome-associated translation inhibitor RaiA